MVATRGRALLASADELHVTVRGRGGHASMPHHACDPVPIACEIVTAIQAMITRRVDVFDPAVVTVSKIRAGTTSNVIPEDAQLLGTIRTVSERTRTAVLDDLRRLAEGIAAAHGAEATVDIGFGYPVTVNDDDAAAFALDTARLLLGESAAIEMPTPVMGAEDWSYVLQQVPGAMAFLGTAPKGAKGPAAPNHSNRMVIDEDAMAAGIATYAGVALRWLDGASSR
jgi:hippurate hydrolase